MMALLQLLLFGHVHKWKQVGDVSSWSIMDGNKVMRKGPRFICQCEKCGKFTKFDLKV